MFCLVRLICHRKVMNIKAGKLFKVYVIFSLLLLALGAYYIYERFFLKDEYLKIAESRVFFEADLTDLHSGEPVLTSIPIRLTSFDESDCRLKYCFLSNCSYIFDMGCASFRGGYDGPGYYRLRVEFQDRKKRFLYNTKVLKNWQLELVDRKDFSPDRYLQGFKDLLSEEYLWRMSSVPISPVSSSVEDWFKNEKVFLSNNYLKSLSLLPELAEVLMDEELIAIFDRELEYLNLNKVKIIKENSHILYEDTQIKYIRYPEAYILRLVDLGLDKDYLLFIDNFLIPEYSESTLLLDLDKDPLLLMGSAVYSEGYLNLVRYSDYSRVFRDYGRDELANYAKNKMIEVYEDSGFTINGLCSLVHSNQDVIAPLKMKRQLEQILLNDNWELIEGNLYELLMCDLYAKNNEIKIRGLDDGIQGALELNTIKVGDNLFVVRSHATEGQDEVMSLDTPTYSLLDNILYLLYENN